MMKDRPSGYPRANSVDRPISSYANRFVRLPLLVASVLLALSVFPALGRLTGSSAAPAAATVTYPLKVSANGRYLVDQTNKPVFWTGDSAWSLMVQLTNSDVDYYLNDRQQKGFNVILVNLLEHKYST